MREGRGEWGRCFSKFSKQQETKWNGTQNLGIYLVPSVSSMFHKCLFCGFILCSLSLYVHIIVEKIFLFCFVLAMSFSVSSYLKFKSKQKVINIVKLIKQYQRVKMIPLTIKHSGVFTWFPLHKLVECRFSLSTNISITVFLFAFYNSSLLSLLI